MRPWPKDRKPSLNLVGQNLDAFLQIDEGDIEAKNVTRDRVTYLRALHALVTARIQCITIDHLEVSISNELVIIMNLHLQANPAHKRKEIRPCRRDDIINSIIKDYDRAFHMLATLVPQTIKTYQ
jgi:hypothetical protein